MSRAAPMTEVRRQRRFLGAIWMPLLTAAFLGYFGYHAFTGAYGIWSMERLTATTTELSAELARLKAEREALEVKVARLRPESLDADLVDSAARAQLNMMRPDEVVLSTSPR